MIGDHHGIPFPTHPDALLRAGAEFLTRAFRAYGTLNAANAVTRITGFHEIRGGSTGRKAAFRVEYAYPRPDLVSDVFVKFSRDFDVPQRDRGRFQMEPEVRFAELSRAQGFPIAVPATLFADYRTDTGTGVLITERVPFGSNGVEPQHHKALDYQMSEPAEHYRALLSALGRLAGWHRSGCLPSALLDRFPVDLQAGTVGDRPPLRVDKVERQLYRLTEFIRTHPNLFPANVASQRFLSGLAEQGCEFVRREGDVWRYLVADPDYLALCHWNANVDNAWFWRGPHGALQCGLMDWGRVSQMNVAMALWGCLCAAEITLWDEHFDGDLLPRFVAEVTRFGGPELAADELSRYVVLYAVMMGITWLLDVPVRLDSRLTPPPSHLSRADPRIRDDESLRAPLQMLTNVLNLWERRDAARLLGGIRTED
ncbi:hypothetical protein ACRCUN_10715 [Mycobacterium sp. LTG2003]